MVWSQYYYGVLHEVLHRLRAGLVRTITSLDASQTNSTGDHTYSTIISEGSSPSYGFLIKCSFPFF